MIYSFQPDLDEGPTVIDCVFVENVAACGGALRGTFNLVSGCVFIGNQAIDGGGGAISISDAGRIENCSLAGNLGPRGAAIAAFTQASVQITHSIIAFSGGGAALASSPGAVTLICCDIYGNEGGDWVEEIADQAGLMGNIGLDPLFCAWESGDLSLDNASPCAPGYDPGCGLIGALPVGCATGTQSLTWGMLKSLFGGVAK